MTNKYLPFGNDRFELTQDYSASHKAYDYGTYLQPEPVYAIKDGFAIQAYDGVNPTPEYPNGALYVQLNVSDGYWHYVHLSEFGKAGNVKKGDYLGMTGMSGNATGIHLHYSRNKNGVFINPEQEIAEARKEELTLERLEQDVIYLKETLKIGIEQLNNYFKNQLP